MFHFLILAAFFPATQPPVPAAILKLDCDPCFSSAWFGSQDFVDPDPDPGFSHPERWYVSADNPVFVWKSVWSSNFVPIGGTFRRFRLNQTLQMNLLPGGLGYSVEVLRTEMRCDAEDVNLPLLSSGIFDWFPNEKHPFLMNAGVTSVKIH